jgi:5-methylcytosine-specific restriction endonuclease McrA
VTLAPARPCPTPHCRRLIRGRGPCHACRVKQDRGRPNAAARGYDATWAAYSKAWLARLPWCGQRRDGKLYAEHSRCAQQNRRVFAQVTDHIVALRDGGSRLDPSNHQSLCRSCNAAKVTR